MMEFDHDLFETFKEEARDNLEKTYEVLRGIEKSTDREEQLDIVYRCIHTIKGGLGIFSLGEAHNKAHQLEDKLSHFRNHSDSLDRDAIGEITLAVDEIQELLEACTGVEEGRVTSDQGFQLFDEPNEEERSIEKTPEGVKKGNVGSDTLRVSLDRIQRNSDLISEIFLIRNQMNHLFESELHNRGVRDDLVIKWEILDNSLRQRILELEDNALAMRVMPIKDLFVRMERIVRSYCHQTGKKIKILLDGGETELDKKIMDSLADPLVHLIRNAMDHGIESPEVRRKYGKTEIACVSLSAAVESNTIVIQVSDDGKGIDADKILKVAQDKGLDTSHVRTERDALELIFAPGFSTAAEVTDVSGRGVGMDAVRAYVESMGGSIDISTELEKGTSFTLCLPISLSVLPVVVVQIGNYLVGLPTQDIQQVMHVEQGRIIKNEAGHYVNLNGRFITTYFIDDFLYSDSKAQRFHSREVVLCLANIEGHTIGFVVDAIEANTELVVKRLPEGCPVIPYVSGVALLATGQPTLIVSLSKLARVIQEPRENGIGGEDAAA